MDDKYDIVVIGAGSAGMIIAGRCAASGMRAAIADPLPFGGTCALRGCNPKRILSGAAELTDRSSRMTGSGISRAAGLSYRDLVRYKNTVIAPVPSGSEKSMTSKGVETIHAVCSFEDENTVRAGDRLLRADKIAVTSGAEPAPLKIEGAGHLMKSDDYLMLEELPGSIAFIGGGYISFEFAHSASRAGAGAVIINDTPKPLSGFDDYIVDKLLDATAEAGIRVITGSPAAGIDKKEAGFVITTEKENIEAALVVHGAGRVPATRKLGLGRAGVETDEKGNILINDYLQSVSNPSVYVAGDANGTSPQLTPVASLEASVAAFNIVNGNSIKPDYTATASAVFTVPPIASVGMTLEQAEKSGLHFTEKTQDTENWSYSRMLGLKHTGFRVITDPHTGLILGAHLIGHNCEEVINLFALIMKLKIPAEELSTILFAYPSLGTYIDYMF